MRCHGADQDAAGAQADDRRARARTGAPCAASLGEAHVGRRSRRRRGRGSGCRAAAAAAVAARAAPRGPRVSDRRRRASCAGALPAGDDQGEIGRLLLGRRPRAAARAGACSVTFSTSTASSLIPAAARASFTLSRWRPTFITTTRSHWLQHGGEPRPRRRSPGSARSARRRCPAVSAPRRRRR